MGPLPPIGALFWLRLGLPFFGEGEGGGQALEPFRGLRFSELSSDTLGLLPSRHVLGLCFPAAATTLQDVITATVPLCPGDLLCSLSLWLLFSDALRAA